MLQGIKLQFKSLRRDKMVWVSGLFIIILAVIIRFYGDGVVIEQSIGYLENQLSSEQVNALEQVAELQAFKEQAMLERYVLDHRTDLIGILYHAPSDQFRFLLQGNELSTGAEQVAVLNNYLNKRIDVEQVTVEVLENEEDYVKRLLVTLTILMALFLGAVFNAFNIVAEKEDRIDLVNQILPMSRWKYIIQKSLIGLLASFVLSIITLLIVTGRGSLLGQAILLLLPGSIMSALLGLYLGLISGEQMEAIVMTKVVLLVFTFVPLIGFLIPEQTGWVKNLFYIFPSYAVFNGILVLTESRAGGGVILNSLIILLHSMVGLWIYYGLSKGTRFSNKSF